MATPLSTYTAWPHPRVAEYFNMGTTLAFKDVQAGLEASLFAAKKHISSYLDSECAHIDNSMIAHMLQELANERYARAGLGAKINAHYGKEEFFMSGMFGLQQSLALNGYDAHMPGAPERTIEYKSSKQLRDSSLTFSVIIPGPSKLETMAVDGRQIYLARVRKELTEKMSEALVLARMHPVRFHVEQMFAIRGSTAVDLAVAYAQKEIDACFQARNTYSFGLGGKICKYCGSCSRLYIICTYIDEIHNGERTADEVIALLAQHAKGKMYKCKCDMVITDDSVPETDDALIEDL